MAWARRTSEPMIPMGLSRSRAFSAGNAAIFFLFASLFSAVFFYAQLLQIGLGYRPLEAGLRSYVSPLAFTDGLTPAILVASGLSLAGVSAGPALPGRRSVRAPIRTVAALEDAA